VGTTNPIAAGDFEAHRKYLDVQILLDGAETIALADLDELSCSEEYDSAKDRGMFAGEGVTIGIRPGMFYVCFPHDAHKACGHLDTPTSFRKAVIKLRLEN
jgi:YhcH/YjgK/YiaL family protein